jgi:hypothetical protein
MRNCKRKTIKILKVEFSNWICTYAADSQDCQEQRGEERLKKVVSNNSCIIKSSTLNNIFIPDFSRILFSALILIRSFLVPTVVREFISHTPNPVVNEALKQTG